MDVLNRQRACEQLFLLSPLNSDTSPFFVNRKMIWYRKWVGARRCQHWRKYHLLTSYFRFYWMLFLKTHQLSLRSIERFYIFCFQLNIDCLFLVFWSWRFNIFFTLREVQIIPFFFFSNRTGFPDIFSFKSFQVLLKKTLYENRKLLSWQKCPLSLLHLVTCSHTLVPNFRHT